MIEKFIEYLKSHIGDIYVWGAQGEVVTGTDWIRKMETSKENADRAIALYKKRKKEGRNPIYAFDCSGLVVCFLLDNKLIKSDASAAGLYVICKSINRKDLKPGDLIFRYNGYKVHHVGVYIGDNKVIEAYGRDLGVVCRDINESGSDYWNKYGRYEALQSTSTSSDKITVTAQVVKDGCKGGYVRTLQLILNGLGYNCGKADGIAGSRTVKTIQAFQIDHKLTADGIAGTKTWNALLKGE